MPSIDIAAKTEDLLLKSVGTVLKDIVRGSALLTTGLDIYQVVNHGYSPEYVVRFIVDALITALGFTEIGLVPSIALAAMNADGLFDALYHAAATGGYQGAIADIEGL